MIYLFNCIWVATRWQWYSTHIHTHTHTHTNNTENVTNQTIHRTTQKYIEQHRKTHRITQKIYRTIQKLRRVRVVPRLCGFYPGICPTTEEKDGKTSVKAVIHIHTMRIHSHNNKNT